MLYYEYYREARGWAKKLSEAENAICIPDDLPDKVFENKDDALRMLAEYGDTVIRYDSHSREYEIIYAAVVECEGEKNEDGTYEPTGIACADIYASPCRFYVKDYDGEVIKEFDTYEAARTYARKVDGDVDYRD